MTAELLKSQWSKLLELCNAEEANEIMINRPGQAIIEYGNKVVVKEIPQLDEHFLNGLTSSISTYANATLSPTSPLLGTELPSGHRVQICMPPAVDKGFLGICARKPSAKIFTLDELIESGALKNVDAKQDVSRIEFIKSLYAEGSLKEALVKAVERGLNIVISGGTSTGKTAWLNALAQNIPQNERVISIEDSREVQFEGVNFLPLVYKRGGCFGALELLQATLRLRPDRILVGELRGAEAYAWMRAVKSGHDGSITTVHADSPIMAIQQLVMMVGQSGLNWSKDQIQDYVETVVDMVIQIRRDANGFRYASSIQFFG